MNNNEDNKIVYLRLDDIIPNRFQPREIFDEIGLEELADSIKEHGVIQPIVVRKIGDKYEIIAGERRSKASALAGLTTIPAIIKNMDDKESAKVSLLENLQRKNLSAIEEAKTYKKILELDGITQDELAKTMGKSQPSVANKLRLLSLPEEVQDALMKNQISERHARSLLNIKDKQTQLSLLDRIKNERLTVRELDTEIKKILEMNNQIESTPVSSLPIPNFNNQDESINPETKRQTFNSFANDYNNMGLDDYKTSLGSNMSNNFANQYQSFYRDSEISNNNQNGSVSSTDFTKSDFSLGSYLDVDKTPNNNEDSDVDSNFLISNIRENNNKPKENQFLPNFDNDQNYSYDNNPNFNNEGLNNFDNQYTDGFQNSNQSNQFMNIQSPLNGFTDFTNFQSNMQPTNNSQNDFQSAIPSINNIQNQGDLFNQPLNLVDVSPNEETHDYQDTNISNFQAKVNDNPLDDEYENILFAKPVPIQSNNESFKSEDTQEVSKVETEEVIDTEEQKNKSEDEVTDQEQEYISLDQERTLFSTRDAILELKKTTDRIKNDGIHLDSEEIDYDDYYQIIIKINKE